MLLTTYKTYKQYVRLRKNFLEECVNLADNWSLVITYCGEDKRVIYGLYKYIVWQQWRIFFPLLGTVNEPLEMIILHTIETAKKVTFGKLTLRNLFLIVWQDFFSVFRQINIQISTFLVLNICYFFPSCWSIIRFFYNIFLCFILILSVKNQIIQYSGHNYL